MTQSPDATGAQPDQLLERLRVATVGSYDVAGELGRGGMAVVYVGTDRQLERRVAIKVMDPRLSLTQGMAARFLQEARIAARLQHPNIIVVHDVRHSDEIIYFVMSLIDGIAVDDLCRHAQPIPIDQTRWILFQATRALAYAHSEGIVHRDIKPANILLNLKGDVILTDFGIAKALGDTGLTQSGTQVGTPMYMSPEQFSGVPVGPQSDQYALGVTAYELIAGRPPFSGDLYQLIAAHGSRTPVPLREVRPDCPAFLANAVMRMLEKDPANRWPSLEDLQDVFGANLAMDGGAARRKLGETVRAMRGRPPGTSTSSYNSGGAEIPSGERFTSSVVVTISPPGATIFVSGVLELRASVAADTGQSLPGAGVQWTSSDESVLVVGPNGSISGVAPGTAIVRASVNGGWSEATIRVEAAPIARLSLTTANVTMRVGDVMRPTVQAVDVNGVACDGVALSWISRSPAIADLDAPGVIRAITPGLAVIDVAAGNVRRSMDIAVLRRPITRLHLQTDTRSLQLGDAVSLAITAFDDLGDQTDPAPARWTSSAPSIIHVDSAGRALAIGPGTARISASVDEASDSLELESLEPPIGSIQLTLVDDVIELGDDVSWSLRVKDIHGASRSSAGVRVWSHDPDILAIDESGTRARAVRIGETLLAAAPEGDDQTPGVSVRVVVTDVVVSRLEVYPANLDFEVGAVAALNAQGFDRRGLPVMNTDVAWTVQTPELAVVEGNGIVRALAPGSCGIRAALTNSDGSVAETMVTMRIRRAAVARLAVTAERTMLEVGDQVTLRATTWDAMDVEVEDAVPVWRSLQPHVAQVEANGRLVALAPGRSTITAEVDGKSGQLTILVAPSSVQSLVIARSNAETIVGVPQTLSVQGQDKNGQTVTPPVQWIVEPAGAATVDANGVMTPQREGAITVRAELTAPSDATGLLGAKNPLSASSTVNARAPQVTAPKSADRAPGVAVGRRRPLLLTGAGVLVAALAFLLWPSSDTPQQPDAPEVGVETAGDSAAPVDLANAETPGGGADSVSLLREAEADSVRADSIAAEALRREAPRSTDAPRSADQRLADQRLADQRLANQRRAAQRAIDSAAQVARDQRALEDARAAAANTRQTPPAYTPPPTPPRAVAEESTARQTNTPPPVVVESANAADLRAIAERIAANVKSGRLRPTPELEKFFADGADHKVSVGAAPAVSSLDRGRMRTQFRLALSRFNAAGIPERRVTVVQIEVAKSGGTPELVSSSFGPLVRP